MKHLLLVLLAFCLQHIATAQSFAINTDGSTANSSAILDIKSTAKGILITRMDSLQRATIPTPATGLLVFQTNKDSGFYFYDGVAWQQFITWGNNLWKKNGTHIHNSNIANVGIGTNNPLARLHITDSSVLFSATGIIPATPGDVPMSGEGRRMMWYPDKAAFRAGYDYGPLWDKDNIGNYSFATGKSTNAYGEGGFASGVNSIAGTYAVAMGLGNISTGSASFSAGASSSAQGIRSVALGSVNIAAGDYSAAFGFNTRALGFKSIAIGDRARAVADMSTAMGSNTVARSDNSFVTGLYNDTTNTNRIFEVGNGTADNARSNAVTVLTNGNVGIGTTTPAYRLDLANGSFGFGTLNSRTQTRDNAGLQGNAGAQSGFFETSNPVNYPSGASSWWYLIDSRHSNSINNFALQIAGSFFDQELWFRKTNNNAAQAWSRVLTSSNGWSTTGNFATNAATNFIGTADAADLVLRTTGTERMRISAGGNVGIGTASPNAQLQLSNSVVNRKLVLFEGANDDHQFYGLGINTVTFRYQVGATGSDHAFFAAASATSSNELMRIKGNGNIGIGTSTPTKQTEIIGAVSATPVTLVIGNRGGFGPAAMEFVSDYDQANQWRPGYIRSNDLGSYTGVLEFYTNGTGVGNYYTSVKGLQVMNGVTYTATGTVNSWSDTRLKKNVQPFTGGLDIINKINPVSFYYNDRSPFQTDKMQIGILAQDLEKVAPYMVDKNVTKDYNDLLSVNNQAYIFLLINAVKEQNKKMEAQQKQIDEQRKLIEQLLNK
jgi:hypothetical protein